MTSTAIDLQVKAYMAAVAARLADLPDEEREDLMVDLEQHLHEVAAEAEGTLAERLGTPEAYAAELRASAGLPERADAGIRRRLIDTGRLREIPFVGSVLDFLPELRPGWWVLRALIAGAAAGRFVAREASAESELLFAVVVSALLVGPSIALGRVGRKSSAGRWISVIANAATTFVALALFSTIQFAYPEMAHYEAVVPEHLHHEDQFPITNICAYSSDLAPIDRVLLFDQDGRPIDNLAFVEDGSAVYPDNVRSQRGFANAYPRKYELFDEQTGTTRSFQCPTIEDASERRAKERSERRARD